MYVLPQPKSVKEKKGEFLIRQTTPIQIAYYLDPKAKFAAELLQKEIEETLGFVPQILSANQLDEVSGIIIRCKGEGEAESYRIESSENRILLEGADGAGTLYAVQTLRQLIREYGVKIPAMEIADAPAIPVRGTSHDVTRGRIPTLDYLKKLADTLSFYKINQLQLNVEHSYLFRNESEVWRTSTPLTAEEIMELDDYCKKLHIDLVPTLASFGHLYELLRSRTYKHLCELDVDVNAPFSLIERMGHHTVDVTNPESLELITSRIREYMNLFSSKYFNICADETFDLGKGKSKKKVEEDGVKEVYIDFLKKLCDFVISCGKTPMYWGDIIVEKPEIIKVLPKEGICLNWEYSPEVKEDNLKKLSATGANIFVCPGVQSWNHMINNHADAYRNILGMLTNAHKYHVKGMLNTDWGDLGHIAHPEFSTVGQIYGAAFSWSEKVISEEEINRRISRIQYRDISESIVGIFRDLGKLECVNWWHYVQYKEEMEKDPSTANLGIVMDAAKAEMIHEKLEKMDALTDDLYESLSHLQPEAKEVVNAYLLMAEGQKLVGQIGATLCGAAEGKTYPACEDPKTLASSWEKWFMRYKDLWRKVSKESELYHLTEVVCWYADQLRDL